MRMPAVNGATSPNSMSTSLSPSGRSADGIISITCISSSGQVSEIKGEDSETQKMKPVPPPPLMNPPRVLNPRNGGCNSPGKSESPPTSPSEWDEAAEYDAEGFMINTSSCHFKHMQVSRYMYLWDFLFYRERCLYYII